MMFRSLSRLIILVIGVVILAELIAEDKPKKKAAEAKSDAEGPTGTGGEGEESVSDEDGAAKD